MCAAQLVLWTSGIVVLTLLVNAPLIPPLLSYTGLTDVPTVKLRMRSKAARALLRFSKNAVADLQQEQDEMLRGEARACPHPSLRQGLGQPPCLRTGSATPCLRQASSTAAAHVTQRTLDL